MIKYQYKDDKWGPVLFCDFCGTRIKDVRLGAVLTKSPTGETPIPNTDCNQIVLDVLHVHKGRCIDAAEKLPGVNPGWEELSVHLVTLVYNLRFQPETLIEVREMINAV